MSDNIESVFEDVVRDVLSSESLSVTSRADINEGFCGTVAAEVYERMGEPEGMRLCRAGSQSDFHYWVEYNGEFYDAERTSGVSSWQDLPFWKRHPQVSEFEYEAWVKQGGF